MPIPSIDLARLQVTTTSWTSTTERIFLARNQAELNSTNKALTSTTSNGYLVRSQDEGTVKWEEVSDPRRLHEILHGCGIRSARVAFFNNAILMQASHETLSERVLDGQNLKFKNRKVEEALLGTAQQSCDEMFLTVPPCQRLHLRWPQNRELSDCHSKAPPLSWSSSTHWDRHENSFVLRIEIVEGVRVKHLRSAMRERCPHSCAGLTMYAVLQETDTRGLVFLTEEALPYVPLPARVREAVRRYDREFPGIGNVT